MMAHKEDNQQGDEDSYRGHMSDLAPSGPLEGPTREIAHEVSLQFWPGYHGRRRSRRQSCQIHQISQTQIRSGARNTGAGGCTYKMQVVRKSGGANPTCVRQREREDDERQDPRDEVSAGNCAKLRPKIAKRVRPLSDIIDIKPYRNCQKAYDSKKLDLQNREKLKRWMLAYVRIECRSIFLCEIDRFNIREERYRTQRPIVGLYNIREAPERDNERCCDREWHREIIAVP